MNRIARIVCAVIAASAVWTVAAPVATWFELGNRCYEQKQFDSAAAYYEKIVDAGVKSTEVFYNLGNAYYRLSKMGPALLYYERALKLSPNDPDIQANIRFLNLNIVDRIPEPGRGFLEAVLWRLHTLLPLQTQLWALLIVLFMLSGLFVAALFSSYNVRLWTAYLSVLLALTAGALGVSAGIKIYTEEKLPSAIVLSPAVDAKNQPEGTTVLFTAHEGTKVRIGTTVGAWAYVSLPNGISGWMEASALGRI